TAVPRRDARWRDPARDARAGVTHLLDLIERVVPRVRLYPRWAQRLFAVTFAMTLTSFFLWVVMAPAASHNAQPAAVHLAIGVAAPQLAPDRIGPRTEDVLAAPIGSEPDPHTRKIAPGVPYLGAVRRGGPAGSVGALRS